MPVNELPTMRDLFAYANENVWTVMVGVVIVLVAVKILFGDSGDGKGGGCGGGGCGGGCGGGGE